MALPTGRRGLLLALFLVGGLLAVLVLAGYSNLEAHEAREFDAAADGGSGEVPVPDAHGFLHSVSLCLAVLVAFVASLIRGPRAAGRALTARGGPPGPAGVAARWVRTTPSVGLDTQAGVLLRV